MRILALPIFFLLLCVSMVAQELSINEANTSITFFFEDQEVSGTMSDFDFTGLINLQAIEESTISGSIRTESLDTDNWLRNRHLRSKKYFSAKAHPRLYFKSNRIESTDSGFRVSGELIIKGISKPVVWNFTDSNTSLIGTTTINTHDYDIKVYDKRSRNKVSITITLPYKK